MDKEEIYTYEDWLKGKTFNKPDNDENASDMLAAVHAGWMSKDVHNKIIEKQKEGYELLIEQHVTTTKKRILSELKEALAPDELLTALIEEYKEKLKPYRITIARRHKNFHLITGEMYRNIMSGNKGWILFKISSSEGSKAVVDKVYQAWVDYYVLQFLEEVNLDVLLYSEKDTNPFNVLVNGTAINCIKNFIKKSNLGENEEIAKSVLAAAEIMAKNGKKEKILNSLTGTARVIFKQPYFKDKKLPTEKTAGGRWLRKYLDDHRGEELFGT